MTMAQAGCGSANRRLRQPLCELSATGARRSDEAAWLVDWSGKLVKIITTRGRNTSGVAYGNGYVWMAANADPFGISRLNDGKEVTHRQIPLGLDGKAAARTVRSGTTQLWMRHCD